MNLQIVYALLAAVLFGMSTPVAKLFVGDLSPVLLAGLLYLGSGLGLVLVRCLRDRAWRPSGLSWREWGWLLAAIICGGLLGPVALMMGLTQTAAAKASLLLNLETVLTAVLAWWVFKEHVDRRIMLGMSAIVLGGLLLAWTQNEQSDLAWWGPLAIAAACLCWALDNNLTRMVANADAVFIAANKGVIAGVVNTSLAIYLGAGWPSVQILLPTMLLGLLGYGMSLVLFVLALRGLGAARTGAYFATAPFVGAVISLWVFHDTTSVAFWLAAVLMAIGVYMHLSEHHDHQHTHEALFHTHRHVHDEHHQHQHDADWDGQEPHSHPHRHEPLTHSHPHFPDIHHRHSH